MDRLPEALDVALGYYYMWSNRYIVYMLHRVRRARFRSPINRTMDASTSPPGFVVHILGRRARPAACERCRGHKLRCQYDSENTVCNRCRRAGAECIQHPGTTRMNRVVTSGSGRRVSSTALPTTSEPSVTSNDDNAETTQGKSSHDTVARISSTAMDMDMDDAVSATGLEPDMTDLLFWGSLGPSAQSPLQISGQVESERANGFGLEPGVLSQQFLDKPFGSNVQSPHEDTLKMSQPAFVPRSNKQADSPWIFEHALVGEFTSDMSSAESDPGPTKSTTSDALTPIPEAKTTQTGPREHTDTWMAKILALTTNLHDLATRTADLSVTKPGPSGDDGASFPCGDFPVDEILTVTQTLISLLTFFLPANCPHCKVSPSPEDNPQSTPKRPRSLPFSDDADVVHHHHPIVGSCGHASRLDIHAILVVISCYTRLMRIYSNLVTHMQAGVRAGVGPGTGLPAMHFGKIRIENDSSLQALLLVRLVLHILERVDRVVDAALSHIDGGVDGGGGPARQQPTTFGRGGDAGYSRRGSTGSQGSIVRSILDMAVQQEDAESRISKRRGITSLKEDVAALEQLLKMP